MAKVYSWEITKSNVYAYIIDPNNIEGMGVYIGSELNGDELNKVVNWTSSCSNEQYKIQFNKIKSKCEEEGYNVIFEDVENYLNVKASCENLRGPAGRGISHIRLIGSDAITRKNTYAIYYDDNKYDTIEIQNGADGKDGINGEPGTNGFDGVSSKFIMIYSVGIEKDGNIIPPEQPTGGTYNFITNKIEFNVGEQNLEQQGWGTDNNLNGVIYMSSRTFTSSNLSTDNEWSIPVRISGEQGIPGKDGSSIEFIYNLTNQEPNVLNLESPNESGYVPSGWTGSPSGVDENNTKEWCSIRTYNNDKNKWGEWQKATIWSNYGVNGQDGDGVQYIYYRTMNSTPPKNPTPNGYIENEDYQNLENEWFPSKNTTYTNINGESVNFDSDWEDNPKGVDFDYQYEWVVTRKYRRNNNKNKNWTSFSNPSLWAKFGVDGKNATSIKKIYALSENTYTVPPLNKEDITGGSIWGTGFPTGYIVGENVVWGAEAEVWSHNYDFVKSYKLVSTKDDNGIIIPPSDANEFNTKDVDVLPTEEDTSYTYLKYNDEYYKWKGEYSDPFLVTGLKGENGNDGAPGETGPAGSRGIPGISQHQMYCLGTTTLPFGLFTENNKTIIPETQHDEYGWLYSDEIPDTSFLEASTSNFNDFAKKEYLGRVLKITDTNTNRLFYGIVIISNSEYKVKTISLNSSDNIDYLYIWCIQGKDIYGKDNNGDDIVTGVSWCQPFKLQGVNGLPGKDGSKGQIIYPMGLYDSNEKYTTTTKKAPYVMDPNDGLYYVLNKEMTWISSEHNNITPSEDYTNNSVNGTNCWEQFESFDALYTSVGIIENGTVGSAVFNGDYMFSQQGIDSSGNTSTDFEKFNSRNPYLENNDFRPNICINFKTGEMWASQGNIKFTDGDIILNGYIKKQKTIITPSNINYYTITINDNTRAASNNNSIPIVGDNNMSINISNEIKYLDFNKIGSFVEFKDFTDDNDIQVCLHSLPGFVTYGNNNILYINYDEVRCLVDNHIYMVNNSNCTISLCTLCRKAGVDNNPEKCCIPIGQSNFINLYCISASINNYERIFWEYSIGKVNDNVLPTDAFEIAKCIEGVPANPCS